MSVHQLYEFRAGTPDALHLSAIPIQFTIAFLARSIVRMAEVFPGGDQELTEAQYATISRWSQVVEQGVAAPSA